MEVYFDFGNGNRIFAGELTGSNGGNISTWENAVASGTTAQLSGWSTTTFTLNSAALAALSGTSGFNMLLNVKNEATSWAAVIDYADFTLTYEPGSPNPVPEPGTLSLCMMAIIGLFGLSGLQRKKK
jgi:hypothetical protein